MKIDKHIYFTNEEYARILDYKEKNKLSFSEAVCFLSISALNNNDILDLEECVWSKENEHSIIFKFNTNDIEQNNKTQKLQK